MLFLSQRDKNWSEHKIGESSLTIGNYGCTLTSLSMLSSYFNCYHNPIDMQQVQSFTPEGLILWDTLRLAPLHFVKRFFGQQDLLIQDAISDPHKGCLIEVQLASGGHHWLVAVGKVPLLNVYTVVDPWDAKKKTTLAYKNNITGGATYSNK